jgi:hypothetical protein
MPLHRTNGQRDDIGQPAAHGERDPQVGRGKLLPYPGQRDRQGGLPGVKGVAGVHLEEGHLLYAVHRGREDRRGLVIGAVAACRDPEGGKRAGVRREPLRLVKRAVADFQHLAAVQRVGGRAVGRTVVAVDDRGRTVGTAMAQREVGRAVPAG